MFSRYLLGAAAACGADARQLARDSKLPAWALNVLPTPPPVAWHGHFQRLLAQSIEAGSPSLERVAQRMAVSPRTLQRRLAEHGTTWRAELNAARQRRAVKARQSGPVSTAALARQLAYFDPRSVRRVLRRWDNEATEVPTTS
jgi:AraC-like DNA-binding protein